MLLEQIELSPPVCLTLVNAARPLRIETLALATVWEGGCSQPDYHFSTARRARHCWLRLRTHDNQGARTDESTHAWDRCSCSDCMIGRSRDPETLFVPSAAEQVSHVFLFSVDVQEFEIT